MQACALGHQSIEFFWRRVTTLHDHHVDLRLQRLVLGLGLRTDPHTDSHDVEQPQDEQRSLSLRTTSGLAQVVEYRNV